MTPRLPFFLPLVLPCVLGLLAAAPARAAARPTVLELFTSESCSSCPPADALLAELAASRYDVLPLGFHVDYWNQLSWRDRFSSQAATARQRDYAASLGAGVYTPQLVVDGSLQAVGSDRDAVLAAIRQAQADAIAGPALSITAQAPTAEAGTAEAGTVDVRAGEAAGSGTVLLIGFDAHHHTAVGSGENGGRTIDEANVVRSFQVLGPWRGTACAFRAKRPAGERLAALVQLQDGRIVAVAMAPAGT